ncbi:hypothetical protein RFI_17996, partial [Reticulomyxa filosa]
KTVVGQDKEGTETEEIEIADELHINHRETVRKFFNIDLFSDKLPLQWRMEDFDSDEQIKQAIILKEMEIGKEHENFIQNQSKLLHLKLTQMDEQLKNMSNAEREKIKEQEKRRARDKYISLRDSLIAKFDEFVKDQLEIVNLQRQIAETKKVLKKQFITHI